MADVTARELVLIDPSKEAVPRGWSETVLERVVEIDQVDPLLAGRAELAGYIAAYRARGADTRELKAGERFVELRVGELLGDPPGRGARTDISTWDGHHKLGHDVAWQFRQLASYREHVIRWVREGIVGRSQLLKKIAEWERRPDSETKAVVSEASWVDWLPRQDDCDLLLTDPPYSTDVDDIVAFANAWLPVALDKVRPTGRAYVCIGAYPAELRAYLNVDPPDHLVLANVLVWTYRNTLGPAPIFDYKLNWQAILYYRGVDAGPINCPSMVEQFSVQDLNAPDGRQGDRYHAWQKPDVLADRLIRHSGKPHELVLDPFAGTGTFLLAAARLGRVAKGCDVDPGMIAIARERGCVDEN